MTFHTGKEWLKMVTSVQQSWQCRKKVKRGATSDTILTCNYQRIRKRHDAYVPPFLCVYKPGA